MLLGSIWESATFLCMYDTLIDKHRFWFNYLKDKYCLVEHCELYP